GLNAELEVLVAEAGREAEIERARQHRARELVLRRAVAPGSGIDHVDHLRGIEPGLHAERDRFGGEHERRSREQVVRELHDLTLTGLGADVEDAAETLERRSGALVDLARTRHHDRERAFLRAADAAADRRVEIRDAAPGE